MTPDEIRNKLRESYDDDVIDQWLAYYGLQRGQEDQLIQQDSEASAAVTGSVSSTTGVQPGQKWGVVGNDEKGHAIYGWIPLAPTDPNQVVKQWQRTDDQGYTYNVEQHADGSTTEQRVSFEPPAGMTMDVQGNLVPKPDYRTVQSNDQLYAYDINNPSQPATQIQGLPETPDQNYVGPQGSVWARDEVTGRQYIIGGSGADMETWDYENHVDTGIPLKDRQAQANEATQLDTDLKKQELATAQQNNWLNLYDSYMGTLNDLAEKQKTPRSWIEYTQRSNMLSKSPWWTGLNQQLDQTPNEQDAALLAMSRQNAPEMATNELPNTPNWLSNMSGGQMAAGQPLNANNQGWFKIPSRQDWNALNPTQQQMFQGYSNWSGNQWQDVESQMNKLYPQWTSPRAKFAAVTQR